MDCHSLFKIPLFTKLHTAFFVHKLNQLHYLIVIQKSLVGGDTAEPTTSKRVITSVRTRSESHCLFRA